jgi:N-acyl-D-aspartate/D-glutamate deacylase
MLDYAIVNGTLVDGTGAPRRQADIGIWDGRIVEVGTLSGPATTTLDATGLIVAPGFIDPHTHFDAQLYWDPTAMPANLHGVTTIIGGNCGFTLAPLKDGDAKYTGRMMAQVEGMPVAALEELVPWSWTSFGDYLNGLEGKLAVNAGFLVGHCALRRYVMGQDFAREADAGELKRIVALFEASVEAGGLGFSTTRSNTHTDGDGRPVASRWASDEEILALCRSAGRYEGTSLEFITPGCTSGAFSDEEIEFMATMSAAGRRPVNWNILHIRAEDAGRARHQLLPSKRARELGGRVVALTMPVFAEMNMSLLTFSAIWKVPGWLEILDVPVPERIRRLKDPSVRGKMMALADEVKDSRAGRLADFSYYMIGDVFAPENEPYRNRDIADIAAERGEDVFTALVNIAAADDLRTVLWPFPDADSPEDWEARRQFWEEEDVLLGGSDAGAHVDRMLGTPYPTRFMAETLRGRKLMPLERAVQLITEKPAQLFGLRARGRVEVGYHADVVVFDPETVDSAPARIVYDLPGNSKRLLADSLGVVRVLVNGTETVVDGKPVDVTPGALLRSGFDTSATATS